PGCALLPFIGSTTSLSCTDQICARRITAFRSQATKGSGVLRPHNSLCIEDHVLQVSRLGIRGRLHTGAFAIPICRLYRTIPSLKVQNFFFETLTPCRAIGVVGCEGVYGK